MQIDIPTLNLLTVGTLCVGAAMTLWECKAKARRSAELAIWAAGYLTFAVGCVVMMNREAIPGNAGPALTNILMLAGYLTLLHGAFRLDGGPGHPLASALVVAAVGAVWVMLGPAFTGLLWNHASALPIAAISGATAIVLARSRAVRGLRSRPVAVAILAGHGVFYLVRAFGMPVFVSLFGSELLPISAKATMIEAVLYSVAMPMAFLALVREESAADLLRASQTDYLTGLGNRHAFFERGTDLLRQAGTGAPVALLALDLDHFKTINDRHGHAAGDEVLKLFSAIARDEVGRDGVLARIGGEEFAALLPGLGPDGARDLAERLCRRFAEETARSDGLAIAASVSIGLAQAREDTRNLSDLLSAADRALYAAKSLGRNRVEFAAPIAAAA